MFIDPDLPDPMLFDELDLVVEAADMMTVLAAQRLVRIDAMRREALRDATRNGRVLTEVVERGVRLELAAALRITEHAAGDLLGFAETLVHSYPVVLTSMERARITERHAEILVAAVNELEPEFRAQVLEPGLALAESEPVGTFRRKLRTLVDSVRSATLTERYERAVTKRRIAAEPDDDGMGWLHLYAPMVAINAAQARATAMAKIVKAADGDTRTLDQARADVMLDLLIDGSVEAHPDQARGVRATVFATVPVLALLHETDASRASAGIDPPVVEGVGPIPLPVARELAGGAPGWTRVLTHPETGMVLSVGRDHYRPPPALSKLVKWRADRCMGPGCGMPASRCDIDHNVDWALGGSTELTNLGPFVRRSPHRQASHRLDDRTGPRLGRGDHVDLARRSPVPRQAGAHRAGVPCRGLRRRSVLTAGLLSVSWSAAESRPDAPRRTSTHPTRYGERMTRTRGWAMGWTVLRLAMAGVTIAAISAQLTKSIGTAIELGRDVPTTIANFFSFFTILSNTSSAIVLAWIALWYLFTGRRRGTDAEPHGLALALACVSTYMIITGIVYNTLLRHIELPQGSAPIPWSNEVLHLIGPIFLLLDVFLGPLRRALPSRSLWAVVAFPIVWVIYTMIRGPLVTNPVSGDPFWYPYPFLNPNGPGGWPSVILYVIGIAAAIVAVGAFVVWWGRRRAATAGASDHGGAAASVPSSAVSD